MHQNETLQSIELDENEAAFSLAICYFERGGGEPFLVIGTGVNTTLVPKACKEGWLRVYALKEQGRVIEFLHKVSQFVSNVGSSFADLARRKQMTFHSASVLSKARCWRAWANRFVYMRWERRRC